RPVCAPARPRSEYRRPCGGRHRKAWAANPKDHAAHVYCTASVLTTNLEDTEAGRTTKPAPTRLRLRIRPHPTGQPALPACGEGLFDEGDAFDLGGRLRSVGRARHRGQLQHRRLLAFA